MAEGGGNRDDSRRDETFIPRRLFEQMTGMEVEDDGEIRGFEVNPKWLELRMVVIALLRGLVPPGFPKMEFDLVVMERMNLVLSEQPDLVPGPHFIPVYRDNRNMTTPAPMPNTDSRTLDSGWLQGTNYQVTLKAKEVARTKKQSGDTSKSSRKKQAEAKKIPQEKKEDLLKEVQTRVKRSEQKDEAYNAASVSKDTGQRSKKKSAAEGKNCSTKGTIQPKKRQTEKEDSLCDILVENESAISDQADEISCFPTGRFHLLDSSHHSAARKSVMRKKAENVPSRSRRASGGNTPVYSKGEKQHAGKAHSASRSVPPRSRRTSVGDEHAKPGSTRPRQKLTSSKHAVIGKNDNPVPTSGSNFPMKDTHDFTICCSKCLLENDQHGVYILRDVVHNCAEDTLAVKKMEHHHWMKIRKKKKVPTATLR